MQTKKDEAKSGAEKDFFIHMLTKDIALTDCILDLLDNSVDGANAHVRQKSQDDNVSFEGYWAEIEIRENGFSIKDNCGGIPLEVAKNVAFMFGRPSNAHLEAKHSIGFYGIGMKRAIFKIGDSILIQSSTGNEAFVAQISVSNWSTLDNWNFEIDVYQNSYPPIGTSIEIHDISSDVQQDFGSSQFINELLAAIARDYMFIMNKGFRISVNGIVAKSVRIGLLASDEFKPLRNSYKLENSKKEKVELELIAGLWTGGDYEISDEDELDPGWYIVCNDRIILAADKTEKTGWGRSKSIGKKWHSQYKPFIGFALFSSDNPRLLPWNTTKRGVNLNSEIYRQALTYMADVTNKAIQYTNERKSDPVVGAALEAKTVRLLLDKIKNSTTVIFPKIASKPNTKPITIRYNVDEQQFNKVKIALNNSDMAPSEVGKATFDYYYRIEAGE